MCNPPGCNPPYKKHLCAHESSNNPVEHHQLRHCTTTLQARPRVSGRQTQDRHVTSSVMAWRSRAFLANSHRKKQHLSGNRSTAHSPLTNTIQSPTGTACNQNATTHKWCCGTLPTSPGALTRRGTPPTSSGARTRGYTAHDPRSPHPEGHTAHNPRSPHPEGHTAHNPRSPHPEGYTAHKPWRPYLEGYTAHKPRRPYLEGYTTHKPWRVYLPTTLNQNA